MDQKKNPDINANTEKDLTSQDWGDEVDLRKAASVVATWWREIVLGTFLTAIMGSVVVVALEALCRDTKHRPTWQLYTTITRYIGIQGAAEQR